MRGFLISLVVALYALIFYCEFTVLWWTIMCIYTQSMVRLTAFDAGCVVVGVVGMINQYRLREK